MTEGPLPAQWFDGSSAKAQAVTLATEDGELVVLGPNGPLRRYRPADITWPEATRHGAQQLVLEDGAVILLPEGPQTQAWLQAQRPRQPLAVRWAWSWRATTASLVVAVALLVGAVIWGIPAASGALSVAVPQTLRARMDTALMDELASRSWLQPSAVPAPRQQALETAVQRMLGAAFAPQDRPAYQLLFRRLPESAGPNAFALPGGTIVISDALLELLPDTDGQPHPGLLGVVAHEIGHVHHRHGLRMVMNASAVGVMMGWWIGDYSTVLAAAPALLLQAGYSRDFEREADNESLRIMHAAGVDPRGMVAFFAALRQARPTSGSGPGLGLATHPPDSERERLFDQGRP